MKRILKENKMFLIIILVILALTIYSANEYRIFLKQNNDFYYEELKKCSTVYLNDDTKKEYCENIKNTPKDEIEPRKDTLSTYFDITTHYSVTYLQIFAPLLIAIAAICDLFKKIKSGAIKNIILRTNYNKYIKWEIIKSYKACFIIPVCLLILLGLSFLLSNGYTIEQTIARYSLDGVVSAIEENLDNIPLLMIVYFINFFINGMLWINIGHIVAKKSKNIVIAIVGTFIVYIVLFAISDIVIGCLLFEFILNIKSGLYYANLSNIWVYTSLNSPIYMLIYPTILTIISTIVLIKTYKNKEGVIIESEK